MGKSSQVEEKTFMVEHIVPFMFSEEKQDFSFKSSAYFCMWILLVGSCHRSSYLSLDMKGIWKPGSDTDTCVLS